jgi:biopolymer transport protein ExbD
MSHSSSDADIPEPDLTPLLDLVLQLLMFFIINVSIASDQSNPDIKLPSSESARPLDRPLEGDIVLNQRLNTEAFLARQTERDRDRLRNADSIILVSNQPPMTMLQTRAWLKTEYERAERKAGAPEKVNVTIHFRPDGGLDYNELMHLMNAVKVAGFRNIKMHAQKE